MGCKDREGIEARIDATATWASTATGVIAAIGTPFLNYPNLAAVTFSSPNFTYDTRTGVAADKAIYTEHDRESEYSGGRNGNLKNDRVDCHGLRCRLRTVLHKRNGHAQFRYLGHSRDSKFRVPGGWFRLQAVLEGSVGTTVVKCFRAPDTIITSLEGHMPALATCGRGLADGRDFGRNMGRDCGLAIRVLWVGA